MRLVCQIFFFIGKIAIFLRFGIVTNEQDFFGKVRRETKYLEKQSMTGTATCRYMMYNF